MRSLLVIYIILGQWNFIFGQNPCLIDHNDLETLEEVLVYDILVNFGFIWIPVGEATFTLIEGPESYYASLDAHSYDRWKTFYEVQGKFRSVMDKESGLTKHYLRHTIENDQVVYDSILFDQPNKSAIEFLGQDPLALDTIPSNLKHCMQDMLSSFYYVRHIPFNSMHSDETVPLHLFYNKYQYDIDLNYLGLGPKKVRGMGEVSAHSVWAKAIKGLHIERESKMKFWISDTEKKVPVIIEIPLKLGAIKIVLRSMNGNPG